MHRSPEPSHTLPVDLLLASGACWAAWPSTATRLYRLTAGCETARPPFTLPFPALHSRLPLLSRTKGATTTQLHHLLPVSHPRS